VARLSRLDVAVDNAGAEGKPGLVTDVSAETYAAMFETNVLGALLGLKREPRIMQAQGSIVSISSTMGVRGAENFTLYAGSKYAVEGVTKSAALEGAAYGLRVDAVAPGPTETEMLDRLAGSAEKNAAYYGTVPLKRGASSAEIADTVVFVALAKATYITAKSYGRTATRLRADRAHQLSFGTKIP
jgi:NAD(P)-dependent dehydrogenase (short-subunit alcohol dehydrogenase family)